LNSNKKGIILINLGSPDSPAVPDVKNYLREFLMDEQVIDIWKPFRTLLVKGIILPLRSPKSAKAYSTIWTEKGSPLKVITNEFAEFVEIQTHLPVTIAMRYANPTPSAALDSLLKKQPDTEEILLAPMYPHYAMSSYETAVEHFKNSISERFKKIKIRVLKPFYKEAGYIYALAESIKPYLQQENFDGYLFSYHGLPVRHLKKSDTTKSHCYSSNACCETVSKAWDTCYKHQVKTTTQLVADLLQLNREKVFISFQSRLGSDEWIQPFTEVMLKEFPQKGVKKLLVVCPAFVTDCLETLEEIDERGNEIFMKSGGEKLVRVPCLNTNERWISAFSEYSINADTTYKHVWS
jgi:protoporphyrin/coproporphyrin ferrochelatase